MGYYSDFAAESTCYDSSYPTSEQQLLWRLEELEDRLEELLSQPAVYEDDYKDSLHYCDPRKMTSPAQVRMAIELATARLQENYGISVAAEDSPATDELTGMQISFLDLLPNVA